MATRRSSRSEIDLPLANPWVATVFAWLVPGAGHAFLGRFQRGLFFFVLIVGSLVFGCQLGGHLPWQFSGSPLFVLASLGSLGAGVPVLVAHYAFGYTGELTGAGFEYGRAFLITAGLMNWMLVLDVWDIAWGKEDLLGEDESSDTPSGQEEAGETSS